MDRETWTERRGQRDVDRETWTERRGQRGAQPHPPAHASFYVYRCLDLHRQYITQVLTLTITLLTRPLTLIPF